MYIGVSLAWKVIGPELTNWLRHTLNLVVSGSLLKNETPTKSGKKGKKARKEKTTPLYSACVMKASPVLMPQALVVSAFIMFVCINQGIVVGDRSAHQATINIPQIFYFAFFMGFMLLPLILVSLPDLVRSIFRGYREFIILTILGLVVVHFNTIVHPYLLADNRHYTFYIWKRLYEWYPITRYLLVPVYVTIWFWLWYNMRMEHFVKIYLFGCLCVILIPQKLLEYRYFIIPYFFVRMELQLYEWKHLIPEVTFYLIINCFTLYQFLLNPFVWDHEPYVIQRFMW